MCWRACAFQCVRGGSQVYGIENGTILSGPELERVSSPAAVPRGRPIKRPSWSDIVVFAVWAAPPPSPRVLLCRKFRTVADSRDCAQSGNAVRVVCTSRSIGTGNGIYTISPRHNLRLRRWRNVHTRPPTHYYFIHP